MSHFTTISTEIRDVDALRDACKEMGLELVSDAEARGYGSKRHRGELVIKLPGPYDAALNQDAETGVYAITADGWQGHVEKALGKDYGRLTQLYGVHKTMREVRRKGYAVQRQSLNDGAIRLQIQGV